MIDFFAGADTGEFGLFDSGESFNPSYAGFNSLLLGILPKNAEVSMRRMKDIIQTSRPIAEGMKNCLHRSVHMTVGNAEPSEPMDKVFTYTSLISGVRFQTYTNRLLARVLPEGAVLSVPREWYGTIVTQKCYWQWKSRYLYFVSWLVNPDGSTFRYVQKFTGCLEDGKVYTGVSVTNTPDLTPTFKPWVDRLSSARDLIVNYITYTVSYRETLNILQIEEKEIKQYRDGLLHRTLDTMRSQWNRLYLPLDDKAALCTLAVNDAKCVDSNLPAYFSQLKDTLGEVKTVAKALKGRTPKDAASVYLSMKYGTRLTMRDTYDIAEGFSKWVQTYYPIIARSYRTVHAGDRITVTDNLPPDIQSMFAMRSVAIRYRDVDDEVLRTFKSIYDLGVLPTASDAWDFVPYSFVANWFLPLDGLFSCLDAAAVRQYLNVLACSTALHREVKLSSVMIKTVEVPDVIVREYRREISKDITLGVPGLGKGPSFTNHYPELSAILIQKL